MIAAYKCKQESGHELPVTDCEKYFEAYGEMALGGSHPRDERPRQTAQLTMDTTKHLLCRFEQ